MMECVDEFRMNQKADENDDDDYLDYKKCLKMVSLIVCALIAIKHCLISNFS